MTEISFFGHDAGDAAVRRRVAGFTAAGYTVTGFMMRRGDDNPRDWKNVDLGQTFDAAYWQRMRAIFKGARVAARHSDALRCSDLIYARNLDMLICAMLVKRWLKLAAPVVYECLDVHHLLTRNDPLGIFLRKLERRLITNTSLLVYSSPAFEREFFQAHYGGLYTPYLLENRLVDAGALPARPAKIAKLKRPLRIGWFGILRCQRTLHLLEKLAASFPEEIKIITAGIPAETQVPDFNARISGRANMFYGGPYQSPKDLPGLYADIDLIWAGDFYQAGYNSKWLLPNRLYEGGYFSVPAIAPHDSETGRWVRMHCSGFALEEPLEERFADLIRDLLSDPTLIEQPVHSLQSLPEKVFVQPISEITRLVEMALALAKERAA